MKVLDFEVSLDEIKNGKLELADLIKTSLWQHSPKWFDRLDFEDDTIFLEPLLFYYFRKLFVLFFKGFLISDWYSYTQKINTYQKNGEIRK